MYWIDGSELKLKQTYTVCGLKFFCTCHKEYSKPGKMKYKRLAKVRYDLDNDWSLYIAIYNRSVFNGYDPAYDSYLSNTNIKTHPYSNIYYRNFSNSLLTSLLGTYKEIYDDSILPTNNGYFYLGLSRDHLVKRAQYFLSKLSPLQEAYNIKDILE
jgi:hypothetical protein